MQVVLLQDGGVQEAVRRSGVDQGLDGDGRLAWDCQMHHETEVVGGGGGKGGRGGEDVCHPVRLLLAGWAVSRHHRWGGVKLGGWVAKLGVGIEGEATGEHGLGAWVGTLGGGKLIPGG